MLKKVMSYEYGHEVPLGHESYPTQLASIGTPPQKLFIYGNINVLNLKRAVGVVGSRKISLYGKVVTQTFVKEIVNAGYCVVSGMSHGVDIEAHAACVTEGGTTLGVLAQGINTLSRVKLALANKIIKTNGVIISEYPPDTSPRKWTYVQRNRLVAGLSSRLLVVEADLNSGSLITANYAKKFGKELFAVPGNITSKYSRGTLQLIKEGANVGYFGCLGGGYVENTKPVLSGTLHADSKQLLDILAQEPLSIEDIGFFSSFGLSQLLKTLTELELEGYITKKGGKYFVSKA